MALALLVANFAAVVAAVVVVAAFMAIVGCVAYAVTRKTLEAWRK